MSATRVGRAAHQSLDRSADGVVFALLNGDKVSLASAVTNPTRPAAAS